MARTAGQSVNRFRYLPKGGNAGDVLTKVSSDDYDVNWGGGVSLVANDPPSPYPGQLWFNTTSSELKVYDGTTIKAVTLA